MKSVRKLFEELFNTKYIDDLIKADLVVKVEEQ